MRWFLLILLTVLYSCAHHDGVYRGPSSAEEIVMYGDPDPVRSSVKLFPPQHEENLSRYFFFLELVDENGKHVDRDLHEFEVRSKKKALPVKVQRTLRGRYYVILETNDEFSRGKLDFYVAGSKLREHLKIGLLPAHKSHTRIKLIRARKNYVKLELILRDKKGRFVETPDAPEFFTDSETFVSKLEHMGNGIWHVTLAYPYGNQLFYVSVRSHGVYFKNLFRFQYVDKSAR